MVVTDSLACLVGSFLVGDDYLVIIDPILAGEQSLCAMHDGLASYLMARVYDRPDRFKEALHKHALGG